MHLLVGRPLGAVLRRFRFTLWPTLFTVPALAILLGLGLWQIDRLHWKTELIANFDARVSAAAVPPPQQVTDTAEWRFRKVRLDGVFLHEKEVLITGKPFEGTAGFHVVTPLRLADGRVILVNRGWVPEKLRQRARRPESLPAGRVTLEGLVRADRRRGYFVPDNEPGNEVWLYVDTAEIARHRGLDAVAGYVVDALRGPGPYSLPIGASDRITVRNEHLQYAITWFLLAATLLAVYLVYHYRRPRGDGDAA